ncbi:MAG: MoaD/ThiS family protein [Hyphomicrobiaceae bacterium]|nr:MoaD/ThiS family protein [Hyphomicrobiaceae bacterium]
MAHITLTPSLAQFADGERTLDLDVVSVKDLFAQLGQRHPGLIPHLEDNVAVAIDGQIFQGALFEPINPDSDVHLLPMLAGG